jgi:hypothetical protein
MVSWYCHLRSSAASYVSMLPPLTLACQVKGTSVGHCSVAINLNASGIGG